MAVKGKHGTRITKDEVNEHGITDLEEQFCHAYLLRFNVSFACRELGLKPGQGKTFMGNPKVRQRITDIRVETGKAFNVTREKLMQELMNIVYADPRLVQDKDIVDWPDEETAAIAEIETLTEYNEKGKKTGDKVKVKRWDKLRAIEMLNKMLGYNMPDVSKVIPGRPEPLNKDEMIEIAKLLKASV